MEHKNLQLQGLIRELRKHSLESKTPLWKRVAEDLSKPTRQRRIVNLEKLNRYSKKDEVVIVPGKVLAAGDIDHSITVAAFTFSQGAIRKLQNAKATAMSIEELLKKNPQAKKVKIIG